MRRSPIHFIRHAPVMIAAASIRAYQVIVRPFLIGACKFHPTCSEYALEALDRHGLFRGGWIALRRIIRCVPGTTGGYDPVPGDGNDPSGVTESTSSESDPSNSGEGDAPPKGEIRRGRRTALKGRDTEGQTHRPERAN